MLTFLSLSQSFWQITEVDVGGNGKFVQGNILLTALSEKKSSLEIKKQKF